jgi:hypothetical protein
MDPALRALIRDDMPPFNMKIAEGFAVSEIPKAEMYVQKLFESIRETFPPGLKFENAVRCTPPEEYIQITRPHNQKTTKTSQRSSFDIAKSQVYMMRYEFSYTPPGGKVKQMLKPRYLLLPYVDEAGFIRISDSLYTISPVLADRVISVMRKTIFVRLIKSRFNINRISQHFILDDYETYAHVVWSKIHQKKVVRDKSDKENVVAESTLAHYLFCKYGILKAFKDFAGADVVVGDAENITKEKYPPDQWHIVKTTRTAELGHPNSRANNNTGSYRPTKLRIAVPKSQMNHMTHNLIGAFYYIADRFPDRVSHLSTYIVKQDELKLGHEKLMWILILGHLVAPGSGPGKVTKEMDSHMRSLDEYIDPIVREQLKNIGYDVENVYQLFARMIQDFDPLLLANRKKLSSMYEKELNVLYFVLFDISKAIMELGFHMLKLCDETNLTKEKLDHVFGNKIRTGAIFHIYKSSGAVSANSYPGDNKVMKITTLLVPQQHTNKMSRKKGGLQLRDPINQLHISVVEVGGYANLPKSQPSGHFRINPFVGLTLDNVILRNDSFAEVYDHAQALIER